MSHFLQRTWAEISVDCIEHNYKIIKNRLKDGVRMMVVVKADAYGHGVKYIAPALDRLGADCFAVSNIEEALQLRELGIKKPILILGYTPPFMADVLAKNNISQTVLDSEYAEKLSNNAVKAGVTVKIHIKIDTGMSRIGFIHHSAEDNTAFEQICRAAALPALEREGIFTHFAASDMDGDSEGEFTRLQFSLFCDIIEKLKAVGITFSLRHCCNSAATLNNPDMQLDMVRPGIILYGMEPSGYFRNKFDFKPAMQLKSVISMIKTLQPGDFVSYGRTYTADKKIKAATVPVGYADGYPRSLSNKGYAMINGKAAPIIGRICMDQMVVDVSDIPDAYEGQQILLFGSDENGSLSVEDYSAMCGTINYETVCIIGKRVTRVYYKDGCEIGSLNYVYNS